uniref:Palmitoyltransferase n=1 Tax=Arcella intermedia TaxID=1963864 RepID=A0A6B2LBQ5_9EUKA
MISFCYWSYWYLIVLPWGWLTKPTLVGVLNFVGLHISFSLLCYSYYKSIHTDPGVAPKGWVPPGLQEEQLETLKQMEVPRDALLDIEHFYIPKWCRHCQSWKPPRAHHCKDKQSCVLKMDHYCPWVYNAVGYRNHKFFILFLFYASISLIYFLICCITRVVLVLSNYSRATSFTLPEVIGLMIQLFLTLPVTIGIFSLFCYQISCLAGNVTSIETYSQKKYKKGAKKRNLEFKWFYDYGFFHNMKEVMGHSFLQWFVPVMPEHIRKGDGVTYRTRLYTVTEVGTDKPDPEPLVEGLTKRK